MREDHVGDAAADPGVADLYRSDHTRITRLAYLLSGDRSFAEEAGQEAFVRLLSSQAVVREPSGYLTTVTVNLCRDHGRRLATAAAHPTALPGHGPHVDVPGQLDDADVVMQAIRQLPLPSREIVVLRYWMDLPTGEIARLLGRRPGTVRSILHRAHAALGEVLDRD